MTERFREAYGPWALVAGASVGIGAEFASQLAARGLDLLLLARQADVLGHLADDLRARHGVEVRTASLDLGRADLAERVREIRGDLPIGLLVYNAAYARIGRFVEQDQKDLLRVIDVNCRGPLILAHELGRDMARRGRGGIILMSSLAGTQGSAMVAAYAATKAFNLVLAEGLWDELRESGVDVLGCRAGATRTPAYEGSNPRASVPLMEPGPVVREALAALGRQPSVVPGWVNRAAAFFMGRLLSRRTAIRIIGSTTRRMYPDG